MRAAIRAVPVVERHDSGPDREREGTIIRLPATSDCILALGTDCESFQAFAETVGAVGGEPRHGHVGASRTGGVDDGAGEAGDALNRPSRGIDVLDADERDDRPDPSEHAALKVKLVIPDLVTPNAVAGGRQSDAGEERERRDGDRRPRRQGGQYSPDDQGEKPEDGGTDGGLQPPNDTDSRVKAIHASVPAWRRSIMDTVSGRRQKYLLGRATTEPIDHDQ
jgi:hypothetical protein